jgi:hypothetical protein
MLSYPLWNAVERHLGYFIQSEPDQHAAQNAIGKSCIVCRRTKNKRASLSSLHH